MYLAEDRILCFEIVTKKREAWVLRCVRFRHSLVPVFVETGFAYLAIRMYSFVKGAKASTDVPCVFPLLQVLSPLIASRPSTEIPSPNVRCFVVILTYTLGLTPSPHSHLAAPSLDERRFLRSTLCHNPLLPRMDERPERLPLHVAVDHLPLQRHHSARYFFSRSQTGRPDGVCPQLVFSFLGLSSFYLAFYFLCTSATSDTSQDPFGGYGTDVIDVANYVYMATIGVCIVCALGNKPSGSRLWYMLVMFVFAALFGIAVRRVVSQIPLE